MAERVWDRFLTDQDRAHVVMKPPKQIGFGHKPALLLIDLYRWVFGDKPEPILEAIKAWPGNCGLAGWNALPHIQTFLNTAREIKIPIIHVTGLAGAGVDEWSFRRDERRGKQLIPRSLSAAGGNTTSSMKWRLCQARPYCGNCPRALSGELL